MFPTICHEFPSPSVASWPERVVQLFCSVDASSHLTAMLQLCYAPSVHRGPRLRCIRLSQDNIVACIKAWCEKRGETNFDKTLAYAKPYENSRRLPPISVLTKYTDLARPFVRVCGNLKPSHVEVYNALLCMHEKNPCLGPTPYHAARNYSVLLRKILGWYRTIAISPDKREQIFQECEAQDREEIFDVVNRVICDSGEPATCTFTKQNSVESIGCRSNGDDVEIGSCISDRTELEDMLDQVISMAGGKSTNDDVTPVRPVTPAVSKDDPMTDLLSAFNDIESLPVAKSVVTTVTTTSIVASRPISDQGLILRIMEASSTPLPSSRGALQRNVTNHEATPKKTHKPTATKSASVVTPTKTQPSLTTTAYQLKKRKSLAYKHARKQALDEGETAEEALARARQAYADCV